MLSHIANPPPTIVFHLTIEHPKRITKTATGTKTTRSHGTTRFELSWCDGLYETPAEISGIPFRVVAIPVVDLPQSHTLALYPNAAGHLLDRLCTAFETVHFTRPRATRIDPFMCQVFLLPTPET